MWRHEKGKNEKGSVVSVTLATPTMRAIARSNGVVQSTLPTSNSFGTH